MEYTAKNARLYKVFLKLCKKIRKEKKLLMTEYVKRAQVAHQWYEYATKHRASSLQIDCGEEKMSRCQAVWADVPLIHEVIPLTNDLL